MAETGKLSEGSKLASDEERRRAAYRESIFNIPNQLTVARLILSVVFFVLLALQRHGYFPEKTQLVLNLSILVFVLAVVTDFLDGYLARKWELTSTFGRIADPFADKIVVCGGFVMLTGLHKSLVEPWFAVVIMFREFLVSGLRSFLESRGVAFGAAASGKLKMIIQSITIPVVIFYEANVHPASEAAPTTWAILFRGITVALLTLTLIVTVYSSVAYVQRALKLIREDSLPR
jgi:CDP-diacylglycerol---glycerol-3-phosphate 3-phosphatidyltransferase